VSLPSVLHWLTDPEIWASLVTLTLLEIVLGIDNLVFIAIVSSRLPAARRDRARKFGLALALLTRLALLASITWLMGLTRPVFAVSGHDFSWRDLVLAVGGLFLLYKGTQEIHAQIEGEVEAAEGAAAAVPRRAGLIGVVLQIMVLDIVFSLDSVITAVGMAESFWVMAAAIILAVCLMLLASGPLSRFINAHPTVRMLALGFLLLVGTMLVADGFGFHIPKGYIYAAIGFSMLVEALNLWAAERRRKASRPTQERGATSS
jgi:predicted tellurium resistance membrane protein TerC